MTKEAIIKWAEGADKDNLIEFFTASFSRVLPRLASPEELRKLIRSLMEEMPESWVWNLRTPIAGRMV